MKLLKEYVRILVEGLFEAPPVMVNEIFDWAVNELKNHRNLIRQGKITSKLKAEKKFSINLSGWKYGDILDDYVEKSSGDSSSLIKYMKDLIKQRRAEGNEISIEQEKEMIDSLAKGLSIKKDYITVIFELAPSGHEYGGAWQKGGSILYIYFQPTDTLEDLKRTIEHELTHMSQDILSTVKGSTAGIPFRKKSLNQTEHDLEDIEFYTVLKDEIKKAKLKNLSPKEVIQNSSFFKLLKRKDIAKYKKAIKELYKNLE